MNRFKCVALASLLLVSCKQSADVVSNHWLQKRKYRKGFHIDIAKQKKHEKTFELGAEIAQKDGFTEHPEPSERQLPQVEDSV